ncbi:hypothetical protein OROGR_025842 [Orobanche gracilis]
MGGVTFGDDDLLLCCIQIAHLIGYDGEMLISAK